MEQQVLTLLKSDQLQQSGICTRKSYSANSIVIQEGDTGNKMYVVLDGSVRVSSRVKLDAGHGIQPGLCDLEIGDVFGEMGLYEAQGARSATVKAVKDSELLEIDADALSRYMDDHPEDGYVLLKALFHVVCDRLRKADERMGSLFAWGLNARGIAQHL